MNQAAGTLYLLPTTLGDPQSENTDTLSNVVPSNVQKQTAALDYFIAENAKTTRAYLKALSTSFPLAKTIQEIEIRELNVRTATTDFAELLDPIREGKDGGLISEAGVPAVADPGAQLVRLAHQSGIEVKPLVGPSSLLLALMASGLDGQRFAFNGYLPTDAMQRLERIRFYEKRSMAEQQTQLFIETPYRNGSLLDAMTSACQSTTLICVATDLTIPSESVRTKTAAAWKSEIATGKVPDFHKKPTVFLLLA